MATKEYEGDGEKSFKLLKKLMAKMRKEDPYILNCLYNSTRDKEYFFIITKKGVNNAKDRQKK